MSYILDKEEHEQFEKPTFRVVNNTYLLLGYLDWRYLIAATVPAVFLGALTHSKVVGIVAWFISQTLAYRIYSRDAMSPIAWVYSVWDKPNSCPFKR
jgi:hypothetical protein